MSQSWPEVRLGEVCEKITVGHVGPMAQEYVEDGIPFLRSQNIKPFSLDLEDIKYITPEFHEKLRKSALRPGDVAIIRTGYPGTAAVIPETLPTSNCADLVIIRPGEKVNAHFLASLFNSTWGQGMVSGRLVGAAQQHFNVSAAKEMHVFLPPLPIQRKIAAVLSAYDDLIENNSRRVRVLEEMARALYREWFVEYRFPGHEQAEFVEDEQGRRPERWVRQTVSQTFSILGGGTPSKAESEFWEGGDINWYTPSDITKSGRVYQDESQAKITHKGLTRSSAGLFPPYSVMMTSRATIGAIGINTTPATVNQGFIVGLPCEGFPLQLMRHWFTANVDKFISLASGATFKEISKSTFKGIELVVPPADLVSRFESVAAAWGRSVENLERRNANLRRTRDLLLPRLVSGELDVSELEIAGVEETPGMTEEAAV